jgi:predicted DNA-binding transcriptional regulator YafY
MKNRTSRQIVRLWQLEDLLLRHPHGLSVAQIAVRMELPYLKIVYRDLLTLSECGVPLTQDGPRFAILDTHTRPGYRQQILTKSQKSVSSVSPKTP